MSFLDRFKGSSFFQLPEIEPQPEKVEEMIEKIAQFVVKHGMEIPAICAPVYASGFEVSISPVPPKIMVKFAPISKLMWQTALPSITSPFLKSLHLQCSTFTILVP